MYLDRPWLDQSGVAGPISPERVEEQLEANPEIKALCLTSPTYYGVLSDLPALAKIMHRHGGVLMVDGAHGAHLPFLGDYGLNAADLLVVSAHKTLPAPGQTALLFSNGTFSHADLRRAGSIYGSSSPSYAMMAALDLCRAHMLEGGADAYRKTAEEVDRLRNTFPALTEEVAPLDPTRLVVCAPDGYAAQDALEGRNVWPEMADGGHVVFIPTCADGRSDFARLEEALRQVELGPCPGYPPPPQPPEMVLTPRQALFAPRKSLPLEQAEGQVTACQVAPYPPGVPVIAPGERVDKKSIAYLKQIGYNTLEDVSVAVL